MNTYYYITQDTTDTLGLVIYASDLAKGLGLVWRGGGEYMGSISIRGAVIGGELYLDTTQIITSVFDLSNSITNPTYNVSQNYPNPFNPVTNIDFDILESSVITLKIFDVRGKLVELLIDNEFYRSGKYRVIWTVKNESIASGVYFYQFNINNKFLVTKSMIFIK